MEITQESKSSNSEETSDKIKLEKLLTERVKIPYANTIEEFLDNPIGLALRPQELVKCIDVSMITIISLTIVNDIIIHCHFIHLMSEGRNIAYSHSEITKILCSSCFATHGSRPKYSKQKRVN